MALNKWTSGDVITEREANNHGIRKGTNSDIGGISSANLEEGDHLYNSTYKYSQVLTDKSNSKFLKGNHLLGADAIEVTSTSSSATKVKELPFIIDPIAFDGTQLQIVAKIKRSASNSVEVEFRIDEGTTNQLILSPTGTSYSIKSGTIDISGLSDGEHSVDIYIDSDGSTTVSLELIEIWGS